ncbi:MAG: efflux RND transporter periplasmic adaptor subunit [Alphaproteobacteria bacterium]
MRPAAREWLKRLALVPPVLIGVAIVAVALRSRDGPEQAPPQERATMVRVIAVPRLTVVPRAIGFGVVSPAKSWAAIAEVSGEVVEIHPRLKRGAILPAGTVLLRIDPIDYELALSRSDASIRSGEAELEEISVKERNIGRALAIERRALELRQRDLERVRTLRERGVASISAVDDRVSVLLENERRIQLLENELDLMPAERDVLEAKLALYRSQQEEAWLDLQRTTVRSPFDLRLSAVHVERTQYMREGDALVEGDGIESAEVEAQFPMDKLAALVPRDVDPSSLTTAALADVGRLLDLSAVVRLEAGNLVATWDATVARVSDRLDPRTRTVGVIVTVPYPFKQIVPGRRPPLTKGMFVEIELRGQSRPDTLVVPRAALHQDASPRPVVYVAGPDDRLERRPVTTGLTVADFAVVTDGLAPGEFIVVSDPVPAIEGMLLDVTVDEAAAERLAAEATGGGPTG